SRSLSITDRRPHGIFSVGLSRSIRTPLPEAPVSSMHNGTIHEHEMMVSCQFLAQNTHPYTSPEKGRKALLERLRQGRKGVKVDTDHQAAPPPDDARDCRPFLEQPHQAIAI